VKQHEQLVNKQGQLVKQQEQAEGAAGIKKTA
jgi:hypothetical protein